MNEFGSFAIESIKLIMYSFYPLFVLYTNFVILGLFIVEPKLFGQAGALTFFLITNLVQTVILIYYVLVLTSDNNSTQEIFPMILDTKINRNLIRINPFFLETIHKLDTENKQICNVCQTYKPPRTIHCDRCRKCFLKNDHHSLFFDTCIGYHNYKYYFIFIVLNSFIIPVILTIVTVDVAYASETTQTWIVFIVFAALSVIALVIFVIGLVHDYKLISNNETRYEKNALDLYVNGNYSQTEVFQEGPVSLYSDSTDRKYLNPYNLGRKENWKEVFGNRFIDWIAPVNTSLSDGTSFRKNTDEEKQSIIDI